MLYKYFKLCTGKCNVGLTGTKFWKCEKYNIDVHTFYTKKKKWRLNSTSSTENGRLETQKKSNKTNKWRNMDGRKVFFSGYPFEFFVTWFHRRSEHTCGRLCTTLYKSKKNLQNHPINGTFQVKHTQLTGRVHVEFFLYPDLKKKKKTVQCGKLQRWLR